MVVILTPIVLRVVGIPGIIYREFYISQVVQDFFDQQYVQFGSAALLWFAVPVFSGIDLDAPGSSVNAMLETCLICRTLDCCPLSERRSMSHYLPTHGTCLRVTMTARANPSLRVVSSTWKSQWSLRPAWRSACMPSAIPSASGFRVALHSALANARLEMLAGPHPSARRRKGLFDQEKRWDTVFFQSGMTGKREMKTLLTTKSPKSLKKKTIHSKSFIIYLL